MSFGRPFYTSSVVASASGSENLINIGNLVASSPVVDLTSSHQHPGGAAPMLVDQPPIYPGDAITVWYGESSKAKAYRGTVLAVKETEYVVVWCEGKSDGKTSVVDRTEDDHVRGWHDKKLDFEAAKTAQPRTATIEHLKSRCAMGVVSRRPWAHGHLGCSTTNAGARPGRSRPG